MVLKLISEMAAGASFCAPGAQPGRCDDSLKHCLGIPYQTGKGHEFKSRPGLQSNNTQLTIRTRLRYVARPSLEWPNSPTRSHTRRSRILHTERRPEL